MGRAPSDCSTHSVPYTTAHTTSDAAAHTTAHTATHASGTFWSSGPIQLRCGCRKYLGSEQERVVLPSPPPRLPTHCTASDLATRDAHLATSHANNAPRPG